MIDATDVVRVDTLLVNAAHLAMKELAEVEVDSAAAAVVVDVGDSVVDAAAAVVAAAAVDVVVRIVKCIPVTLRTH